MNKTMIKSSILLIIFILVIAILSLNKNQTFARDDKLSTDASSGEYVYGANVVLKGTTYGSASNIT